MNIQEVARIAKRVGIPVNGDTGFPTEYYSSVEVRTLHRYLIVPVVTVILQCMLIWLTLGYSHVPHAIEDLTLQVSETENSPSRRTLPNGFKLQCGSDMLNFPNMLEHLSARYTCLRRCRVGCREWVRAVGETAGVQEWLEVS